MRQTFAYFVGGPYDLTKKVLSSEHAPSHIYFPVFNPAPIPVIHEDYDLSFVRSDRLVYELMTGTRDSYSNEIRVYVYRGTI